MEAARDSQCCRRMFYLRLPELELPGLSLSGQDDLLAIWLVQRQRCAPTYAAECYRREGGAPRVEVDGRRSALRHRVEVHGVSVARGRRLKIRVVEVIMTRVARAEPHRRSPAARNLGVRPGRKVDVGAALAQGA